MRIVWGGMLARARTEKWPVLICLAHRKIGPSTRYDQMISMSGPGSAGLAEIILALIRWDVNSGEAKATALDELKALVAAL